MSRPSTGWALVALLVAAPADGQTIAPGSTEARQIDSVFARLSVPGSPGCALGVVRNGAMTYARGYGLASVELGVPITPATVFDIGSVSKQFTAMAVVLLAQDGKLSLDDEIQTYLPEIPHYARPITLRHLLHHTSGLRDYIDILSWSGFSDEAVTTDADALLALAKQKGTNFPAGAEFLYSNSGFFLLSVVVQRVGGASLRDFAARRIFQPLGMTHTQIVNRHDMIVPGKAGSYSEGPAGQFRLAIANWEQTGDGAVNTTVEDLVKWDRNFVTGEVGGRAALRELETTGVLTDGKPITYALGLNVDSYRGVRRVSHGGSWAGFRAHVARFPDQQVSIFTLCNVATGNPGGKAMAVADLVLDGTLAPVDSSRFVPFVPGPAYAASREALTAQAGSYHSDELLADLVVTARGDSLFARPGLGAEIPLQPTGVDTYSAFGTRVMFQREGGRVTGLSLTDRGLRHFMLSRLPARQ